MHFQPAFCMKYEMLNSAQYSILIHNVTHNSSHYFGLTKCVYNIQEQADERNLSLIYSILCITPILLSEHNWFSTVVLVWQSIKTSYSM